jgi:catabolite regulation protein CreA
MDFDTGIPPEIVFLCTTSETKEKAVHLFNYIRHSDIKKEIADDPAVPAICCLIASEQSAARCRDFSVLLSIKYF